MKFKLMLIAACMAMLAGCSGTPSESEMSSQIEQKMNQMFGVEFVEIENLEKTNGRTEGENKYIASVSYDVLYTKSSDEVAKDADLSSIPGMSQMQAFGGRGMMKSVIQSTIGNFKEGDTVHLEKEMPFVKTENGWVLGK